jgi:cell wall-associated NlpC family hydrolase
LPAGLLRPRLIRAAIVTFLAAALLAPAAGATAHAATPVAATTAVKVTTGYRTTTAVAARILQIAAAQYGKPYRYGSPGPNSFDCSGLTSYVFGKVGIRLPHSAAAQYGVVRHVAKADKRPGDLIFMYNSSGIYHVAIYAGNNKMWAATHTGDIVRKESLYSSSYKVGRA